MTLWNPEYRIKVDGSTVTGVTLAGMTITAGRTDIYAQPQPSYCSLSLLEVNKGSINFDINDTVLVEVKDTTGTWVSLFGGFISDIAINVDNAGVGSLSQSINIIAVGALARLARSVFTGNLSHNADGDMIYEVLSTALFDSWNEVPASLTWATYDPSVIWTDARNNGLGEIDRPGDFELHSQSDLDETVYNLASRLATSALGYLYEDELGRIGYADSTHRSQYLSTYGYVDLDANQAIAPGLNIIKKAGDVRNSITVGYGATGSSNVSAQDLSSIGTYGLLGATVTTTLRNQTDAQAQADFYVGIRANPQFQFNSFTYELQGTELDDADRNSLLRVFMGLPLNISNLPTNMSNGSFQGFVEGWTFTAGYNRLRLTLTVSPIAYSLQAFRWNSVPATETWQTISPTLDWLNATIVA